MNELTQEFAAAIEADSLIQLVLSRPVKPDPSRPDDEAHAANVRKIVIRPVDLKSGRVLQFTLSEDHRETHQNFQHEAAVAEVDQLIGARFRNAHLFTNDADISAKAKASGKVKLHRQPPSKTRNASEEHNRTKNYLIPEGTPCPFLVEIGVMTDDGRVRKQKYDKFRQINRYLEFVQNIFDELPKTGSIRVVDFGCGKSYLTFALHHLLNRIHGRRVHIIGLDLKEDVVEHCNDIASRLHCDGLSFQAGDMSSFEPEGDVDLSVSLHACDTATDVALARGVAWNAKVIFAVPCCHHEVSSKLDGHFLSIIQRHGILRERLAEMLTDSMRADLLEACAYRVKVSEFISLEHTPRNILIRAIRIPKRPDTFTCPDRVSETRAQFGLEPCALERLLSDS